MLLKLIFIFLCLLTYFQNSITTTQMFSGCSFISTLPYLLILTEVHSLKLNFLNFTMNIILPLKAFLRLFYHMQRNVISIAFFSSSVFLSLWRKHVTEYSIER